MNRPIPRPTRWWMWRARDVEGFGHELVELVCAVLFVLLVTGVIR